MNPEDKSKIGDLNERLYSRTSYEPDEDKRHVVKDSEPSDVKEKWESPALDEMLKEEREMPENNSFMKKAFVFAVLFFIAALIVAGFMFLGGSNFVSTKNVEVNILGPSIANAGEALELGISIENNNNADFDLANLSIQYPAGSRNASDTTQALTFSREELGPIDAGDEATRNIRVVLLGGIGEVKEFKFSIEYKVKGSNATFYKDKVFEVIIGDAPISVSVESPRSITSGEEFETKVSVTLNAPEVLKDVVLKAEYPYGYSPASSQPVAISDNNTWSLGDLSPGDKKTITIRGRLIGENEEERTFRFYVGVSDSRSSGINLRIALSSMLNTVAISRPAIALTTSFNGDDSDIYLAPAGRSIGTVIRFKNNLSDKLVNPRLEVRLSGAALDKSSINSSEGFYDSLNSKVVWDISNSSGARELLPGESGQVSFNFASLSKEALTNTNSDIKLTLALTGSPVGESSISVSETKTVRIASQLNLSSKVLYSSGPFTNSGPIPPKAEKETTYTVIFNVGNTQGDITPATLTARLGPGVKWIGSREESSEDISYNEASNTITWDLGTLSSGSGFSSGSREAAFQVALTPSTSQVGTVPNLVSSITFIGTDGETGAEVRASNSSLTTTLTSDSKFIQGDDVVQK